MYISLEESRDKGFKNWSDGHPAASNDNPENIAEAAALREPPEAPRYPWTVPGVGNNL
jgi:hypothetical protein